MVKAARWALPEPWVAAPVGPRSQRLRDPTEPGGAAHCPIVATPSTAGQSRYVIIEHCQHLPGGWSQPEAARTYL